MELRVGNVTIFNYFDLLDVVSFCWFIPYEVFFLSCFVFANEIAIPRLKKLDVDAFVFVNAMGVLGLQKLDVKSARVY